MQEVEDLVALGEAHRSVVAQLARIGEIDDTPEEMRLGNEAEAIAERIIVTPVAMVEGLRAKAEALRHYMTPIAEKEEALDRRLLASLLRDLEHLA